MKHKCVKYYYKIKDIIKNFDELYIQVKKSCQQNHSHYRHYFLEKILDPNIQDEGDDKVFIQLSHDNANVR